MNALHARFKILIFSAIEEIDSFTNVFHRMRVHEVHDDKQSHAMSCIHQLFQFFRSTETRAGGKEIRHMVTERAIVRMFGYRHELHSVVSTRLNTR